MNWSAHIALVAATITMMVGIPHSKSMLFAHDTDQHKQVHLTTVDPIPCTQDGQVGCIATTEFPALSPAAIDANNIATGVTVAGTDGALIIPLQCTRTDRTDCQTTDDFPSIEAASADATKIINGTSYAGVAGTAFERPSNCTSEGVIGCVTTSTFVSVDSANIDASKILTGTNILDVTGTYPAAPLSCTSAGQADCTANAAFPAYRRLTDAVVAHWTFDEASGGASPVVRADSANNYDLADPDQVPSGAGKMGNAANLVDGAIDNFSTGAAPFEVGSQGFSISIWFNATSLAGAIQPLVAHSDSSLNSRGWHLSTTSSNDINFVLSSSGTNEQVMSAGVTLSTSTWYHVAATYDYATGERKIYVDGKLEATDSTYPAGTLINYNAFVPLTIGYHNLGDFDGLVDELTFWKGRVLTTGEVVDLYNSSNGRTYSQW